MALIVLIKGIIIGLVMAIPVGPIGILVIRKTLTEGRIRALIIGLGAATADMLYGSVAAFGLTIISDTLIEQKFWIRLIGGILLLALGIKTYFAKVTDPKIEPRHDGGKLFSYFYTVFLTLTNPLTIFSFIGIFAVFGLDNGLSTTWATLLVTGILIGSFLWFLILSSGVSLVRKNLTNNSFRWINRVAGILILISGIYILSSLFY